MAASGNGDPDDGEWDEWGDDHAALIHSRDMPSSAPVSIPSNEPLEAASAALAPSPAPRSLLDWRWDFDALDAELAALAPSRSSTSVFTATDTTSEPERTLHALASLVSPTRTRLSDLATRTRAVRAQAVVAQWKLHRLTLALATATTTSPTDVGQEEELMALESELRQLAGDDWGCVDERGNDHDDATEATDMHAQLHEMSRLLQHALAACDDGDGDTAPFQQALEQLFASLPEQRLVVPVSWIRPTQSTRRQPSADDHDHEHRSLWSPTDPFVMRLVALCDNDHDEVDNAVETTKHSTQPRSPLSTNRVRSLADAQVFQDTKDIQRDELVVDGEHVVGGAVGYDAVVATIVRHLRHALAPTSLATTTSATLEATLERAAQHILTACNRTESGGCSYEILSQFVTQHATHRVLIRPASAKAPPLEIACDAGAFATHDAGWCFGLRVRVAAVTWYCVCDADDPTHELYDVETTYMNRLAFPLGLAPLAPHDLMRLDGGDVTLTLRRDHEDRTVPVSPAHDRSTGGDEDDGGDVDFDALM